MKITFYIILLGIVVIGCKKEVVPNDDDIEETVECDCEPLPEITGPNFGFNYIEDTLYDFFPQYNPNNDNEILYCTFNGSGGVDLNRYNFIIGQKSTLYSGAMTYAPSWGKGDWILFDQGDGQIWKMKSNGDSLQLATNGGFFFHPKWNDTGDLFMSFQGGVDNSQYYNGKVWDMNNNIVDSIDLLYSNGDWNSNNLFGAIQSNGDIHIYDLNMNVLVNSLDGGYNNPYHSFNWISDDRALVCSKKGIFQCDVQTGDLSEVKCSCDSRLYIQATTNSDRTKIIYTEMVYEPIGGLDLLVSRQLVEMNVDGSSFTRLDLP